MEENKDKVEEKSPYDKQHLYSNVKVPVKVLDFLIIGCILFMALIIFTA